MTAVDSLVRARAAAAGSLSDEELHEWYRSADALAFPSLKEGWGLAVLEAMAADLPVVSSDIGAGRELVPSFSWGRAAEEHRRLYAQISR